MTYKAGSPPPSVLLFDVMGTLVFDPFYVHVPAFFKMSFDQLLREKHPTAWIEFELGTIDEPTFLSRFFRDGRTYDHEGLKEMMRAHYEWLPGMDHLVAQLGARGTQMHALSNYTPWYHMIEEKTGLSRHISWSFVSCNTGVRKPDPRAYLHAVECLGVDREQCLFVDDREKNFEAAIALGIPAILFQDAEQLRAELLPWGMLSP